MAEVNLAEKRQSIEIYVEGKLYGSIVINPSVPNGCQRIYEALAHEREVAGKALEDIQGEDKEKAVISYMEGMGKVAGEIIDGIAEAIGPSQYETIADLLPCIEMRHLIVLALSIIESYSRYYTGLLSEGFKKRGE